MSSHWSLKSFWDHLTGDPAVFKIEERVYHSICLIVLGATVFCAIFDYLIGLTPSTVLAVCLAAVQSFLFYLSRYRKKNLLSLTAFGIVTHAVFILNYFINSGINGPTLLLLGLSLLTIIISAPKKQTYLWAWLNILCALFLLTAEYIYPEWINVIYPTRFSQFIHILLIYFIAVFFIYIETRYIRSSYENERNKAELRASEMEKLNQEKNKLFSIISHDLRMPLATIQHYLELLSQVELKPEEKSRFENELLQITRNTQDMLSNLLFWSKAQLNGLKINLSKTRIDLTLQQLIEIQRAEAKRKGIAFNCNIDPSLIVSADPDMLQLVIRNLISNAIKFTPAGKSINIEALEDQGRCLIIVEDSGKGIMPEKQKNLFSLKATSTYGTENEKGVGLGLVLCKEFITAQHGKIWFESTAGIGTKFFVSIPLHEETDIAVV